MRDLAARLREIVRTDQQRADIAAGDPAGALRVPFALQPPREADIDEVAAGLGGTPFRSGGGACVVIDRTWTADRAHGRNLVGSYAVDPTTPLGLFDPRLSSLADWASRVVFFDIETTGLSGGAGTVAFLAGCGWFEDGAFIVRQFFLAGPAGERALLEALGAVFDRASLLVTFNGKSFDLPVMDMRWAFHRLATPSDGLPHFDMLPPARRLWGRPADGKRPSPAMLGAPDAPSRCSLSTLERTVLGFRRKDDVPGFEIPGRYFQFLRTGDTDLVEGVLEHNRHDLISLAAVTSHALQMGQAGPEACRDAGELLGLGRLYERAGDAPRALQSFELCAERGAGDTRRLALAGLAVLLRRQERFEESAAAWTGVLEMDALGVTRRPLSPLGRRAAEALAIHHEHRARNPIEARRYADLLSSGVGPVAQPDVAHRIGRLSRKIEAARGPLGRLLED